MQKFRLICLLVVCAMFWSGGQASAATYTVKAGDCLWTIANSTGVSVDSLKQLNGLSSDLLSIGQVLQVAGTSAPAPEPAAAPTAATSAVSGATTYIVRSGDNLWSIAQRYGTTVDAIMSASGLNSDRLQVGDVLTFNGASVTQEAVAQVSRSGSSTSGAKVLEKAAQYLGTPYRYGGSAPGGFDCSGFTQYIFRQFDIGLNRSAAAQYSNGYAVSKSDLVPGDLVFFDCTGGYGISHVGIYSGNGEFIHSSSPRSGGVIYSPLNSGYYANTYVGARRVIR